MFSDLNTESCQHYYILGNEEYKWMFPFNLLQRQVKSGEIRLNENKREAEVPVTKTKVSVRSNFIYKFFYPFLEFIGIFHCISRISLSERLKQWIDEFDPDIIYAQASTRETVVFCSAMYDYIQKPMVFHMMDDWPSTISEIGPFRNYWRRRIDGEFRNLLDRASVLLSISDYMADEYKTRYGKRFTTFHNPIDLAFWKSHQRKNYRLGKVVTIMYAGRIGTGIQDSLETMSLAVENAVKQMGIPVQFVMQTALKPDWIEKYPNTIHKSLVPYAELPRVFAEADALLLPYDFSDDSIKFIRHSMPTKAPEYMVSGTPTIVFAPEVTALAKDALNHHWAMVVTENSSEKLTDLICDLVRNEEKRKQVAQKAIATAETKYNAEKVRSEFRQVISSLVYDPVKAAAS
jgi:glycosyltransferase involved in cell wall biosynthesis